MNKYDPDYMKLKFTYKKNKHILFYGCQKNYIIIKIRERFIYLFIIISYSYYYVMVIMMQLKKNTLLCLIFMQFYI